ncbi:MAG: hypothetical protein AB1807_22750 [Pseudomonadota bacterium]
MNALPYFSKFVICARDVARRKSLHGFSGALCAGWLLLVPLCAGAQEAAAVYTDTATALRFPQTLSQLRYEQLVDFGNSELGYCIVYRAPDALGQICVYDLGYQHVPTGVDSEAFKKALDIAVESMTKAFSRPPYANGELTGTATPSIEGGGKLAKAEMRLFASEFLPEEQGKQRNMHMILMTGGLGKVIKLIYTMRNPQPDAFAKETRDIVEAFVRFNGTTMKQLLVEKTQ